MIAGLAALLIAGGPGPATAQLSPQLQGALDREMAREHREDRSADQAHAKDTHWSGSTSIVGDGQLHAGQDLTSAIRDALASVCHEVSHATVLPAYIRVDKGAPHPQVTCKLARGGTVTVGFGRDNAPYRIK
jgi:hypothetical protein